MGNYYSGGSNSKIWTPTEQFNEVSNSNRTFRSTSNRTLVPNISFSTELNLNRVFELNYESIFLVVHQNHP